MRIQTFQNANQNANQSTKTKHSSFSSNTDHVSLIANGYLWIYQAAMEIT